MAIDKNDGSPAKKRGRPFQPGNRFGRGRPKGSPNKKTLLAQQLFEDHSPAIMARALNSSMEDPQMLRMLARYVVPKRRDTTVNIGSLPMDTFDDLNRASAAILKKAASGKVGLEGARGLSEMIEKRRQVLESQNLDKRVRALESMSTLG